MANAPSSDTPTCPVAPGDLLAGKYRVERILGQGGMGVVVMALHEQLEQRVAIKFLLPQTVSSQDAVTRFQREARAATKIQSEHVVRVIDVGTLESGAPFMVMEYLEGQDLSQLLEDRGLLSVEEAVDYILQACEALAEAHAAGIVHRDLKPANIYLAKRADGSSTVKILDFGISKVTVKGVNDAMMTRTSALMGSPVYMSPEQMKATRDVDARADIWALGIIMHELLTGGPVFTADTIPQLCAMILGEPAIGITSIRRDVPAGVEAAILRCLEKDASRRFQNVAELVQALADFAPPHATVSIERVTRIIRATGASVPPVATTVPPRSSSTSRAFAETEARVAHPLTPRTISSFGGTHRGARGSRTAVIAVLASFAVLFAGAMAMFVSRARHDGHGEGAVGTTAALSSAAAPVASALGVVSAAAPAAASGVASALASAPASASASGSATGSASASGSASGAVSPSGSANGAPRTHAPRATHTVKPPAPPKATAAGSDFGDRK